jgi:7,8-dihydropterin-6-yl-methyl-4-(beta-D-ribofuranosyl)aminobenzene 5'-phosphate synthase
MTSPFSSNQKRDIASSWDAVTEGIGNTIEHISKITGEKEFYALIGGTHLVSADEKKIKKTMEFLKKYRFKKIVPLHCTGIKATFEIFKNLGEVFVPGCVGTVIEI